MVKLLKLNPDYCALPRKVSQWVLKQVDHDWQAFFAALVEWEANPEKFAGRPRLPRYKHKTAGRNLLVYTDQAVSRRALRQKGVIQPSQLAITIKTQQPSFDQVRIVPRKVNAYLHLTSRRLIDLLLLQGVGTLIIGKNDGWKQEVNLGSRANQNFAQIPRARFIAMLTYKAELVGIQVILTEESYTSKCSFLDHEPIGKQAVYAGKRVKRGLFMAADGRHIHADVNGSYNIMRKVIPDAFSEGIGGAVVHPARVTPA
jgi:IS605 OrfB family transposase